MKVLLACGGTGGDIFPAVAVAQALTEKKKEIEIVFVGTNKGMERAILNKTPWRMETIEKVTFADKKGLKKVNALLPFLKVLVSSFRLLKREKPNVVAGVGGYVAAPVLMMAFSLGIPALTIEPNAIPGLANRVLKYFVGEIIVAYPETERFFGKKASRLGVPVRKDLISGALMTPASDRKIVFIFGGSLGAKKINEGILEALPHLKDWRAKIHFIHQIGSTRDAKSVQETYQRYGFSAEIYPFIEKMGPFYGQADFVISRAGGNTIAELVALQKPSLLVPYPYAREKHQEVHARFLEKIGGAKVLLNEDLTGERLAKTIHEFLSQPELLAKMSKSLKALGSQDAAEKVAQRCLAQL